jgi:hypothetical protein
MPYELSSLIEKFKVRGLDLAEDAAAGVVDDVCSWFEAQAKASPTPFDDVALVVLPQLRKEVLKLVDGIDGKVG